MMDGLVLGQANAYPENSPSKPGAGRLLTRSQPAGELADGGSVCHWNSSAIN
jgi:hypothetical protein